MSTKDQILSYMQLQGPLLPTQLAKHLSMNSIFASAHLSELASQRKVRISKIKVGGSPLYFLPGQESHLERFSENLHGVEKKAYDMIKDHRILSDESLEPAVQVAIRSIKDFALPLEVNTKDSRKIFWKWHSVDDTEARERIGNIIDPENIRQKIYGEAQAKDPEEIQANIPSPEKPASGSRIGEQSEKDKSVGKIIQASKQSKNTGPETQKAKEGEREEKPPAASKVPVEKGEFLSAIQSHFEKNSITILEHEKKRKNEHDLIVSIPSPVGELTYYCKARDKRSINDGDISTAFIQSQSKKLPLLFLTTGRLTKRASDMAQKEFKGMAVLNL